MDSDDVQSISTAFKCVDLGLTLTEEGLKNYGKVLALVFEFIRKLKEEWLQEGEVLDVWQEEQTVSNLKYDIYTAQSADDHVCEVSQAMIWCDDIK